MAEDSPRVDNLTAYEQGALEALLGVWREKQARNWKRETYYNGKNRIRDLGMAIPREALRKISAVVGWPAKAVDALAERSRFDGFTFAGETDTAALDRIMAKNRFKLTYSHLVTSELIHSCAFVTVGGGGAGEPDVVIVPHTARQAAGIWNERKKRLEAGLVVTGLKRYGAGVTSMEPERFILYTDEAVVECAPGAFRYQCVRHPHGLGRPLMEPLSYRPSVMRPFGKSRVSRAVMSITDDAVREVARSEVSAELSAFPQKYLLGTDEEMSDVEKRYKVAMGIILNISKDSEGDKPTFGQLAQVSTQPHIDYMRSLAARFSGETGIPISSLGVIHDNPASAEAIYAAKEDLVIEAESLNETNGESLKNVGLMVAAMTQHRAVDDLDSAWQSIYPKFRNPAMPSIVSQSDAMVKQASVAPWIADTDVFLEELGYTEEQRERLLSDKRRAEGMQALRSLAESAPASTGDETHGEA